METQQLAKFQENLCAAIICAELFNKLLEEEKKQLTSTKHDEVTGLLKEKERLTSALSAHQDSILNFCKSATIEPTYGAMRAFLYRGAIVNAESILTSWTQLKNALIKSSALNKTNEAILTELIRRNKIKQGIIHNLGRQTDTYSVQGRQSKMVEQGWVEQV